MIKLTLLPKYYGEGRRIRNACIICLVLLGIEAVPIVKIPQDLHAQEIWYNDQVDTFTKYKTNADAEVAKTKEWDTCISTYDSFIKFFSGGDVKDYNKQIAETIQEAANELGGSGAWFDELNISGDQVKATGEIRGMMNFVHYYLNLKKANDKLTLTPKCEPFPGDYDMSIYPQYKKLRQLLGTKKGKMVVAMIKQYTASSTDPMVHDFPDFFDALSSGNLVTYWMTHQVYKVEISGTLKKKAPSKPSTPAAADCYEPVDLYAPNGATPKPLKNVGGGGGGGGGAAPAAGGGTPAAGGGAPPAGGATPPGGHAGGTPAGAPPSGPAGAPPSGPAGAPPSGPATAHPGAGTAPNH